MKDNSNKIQSKQEAVGENLKYQGVKSILILVIILNCLVLTLLNPISFKIIRPDFEINNDHILLFTVICSFSFLIILLYIFQIYLLKNNKRKFPTLLSDLSLMILVFLILFIFAEIIIRLFLPYLGVNLYGYNKKFQMDFMKPNLDVILSTPEYKINYCTNTYGLRGNKELSPKQPNEKRIMVLGDSFIHAAQVNHENTMCYKLEEFLNNHYLTPSSANRYSVINAAMSGWTPTDERIFLEKTLLIIEPDVVLLFIYVGNDFGETIIQNHKPNSKLGKINNSLLIRSLRTAKTIMINQSKLFTFIYQRITEQKWPMGRANQPFHNTETNVFSNEYNENINNAYHIVESDIIKIQDICKRHDISFFLIIIPTKEQVDSLKLKETVDFLKIDMKQIDITKPQKLLYEFAAKNNIPIFDLLSTLREAGKSQSVYFEIDSHWNPHGNFVVAEAVFNYLKINTKSL